MDKSLGDILDWLEKNEGKIKNTIVIFMCRTMAVFLPTRAWRDPPLHTQNAPAQQWKKDRHTKAGIRVPMIVKWQGTVKPGTTCGELSLIIEDFFPTILEMAEDKKIQSGAAYRR